MWLSGTPILVDGKQVAEVMKHGNTYIIRNKRPNGTIGICFTATDKVAIIDELTKLYGSSWTKGNKCV